jgi:hypothetical protein
VELHYKGEKMTGETPLKKAEKETALLEKISLVIPGFRGYKLKEMRREADRLIRDNLYRKLEGAESSLKEIFQRLVINKFMDVLDDTDRLIARFDRVSELINHASYGYSGFFDAVKIEEDDLDTMISFDLKLVDDVKDIEAKVKQFKGEVMEGKFDKVRVFINDLRGLMENLEATFDERKEAIMGVQI